MPAAAQTSPDMLGTLAWYARDVLRIEGLLSRVTVKRRRNLARPVKRRRSAFRDPVLCYDFLAMAWLGATRLSQIEPLLKGRRDLARTLGLPRFCDHTTAHNFLNAFHVTHLRQLDAANEHLLREHGSALSQRAPILDLDATERRVRRAGRRHDRTYRWAVAFCAGEALAQELHLDPGDPSSLLNDLLARARQLLRAKPRLVRITGACASREVFRALARRRLPFLAAVTWAAALADHPDARAGQRWATLPDATRVLDLGSALSVPGTRQWLRTLLVERPAPTPGARRERLAIVTSLLREPMPVLVRLAASMCRIGPFFGHPRWPFGDGKLPSGDPRGNAAFLRLATIAMNVLRLFARQLGEGWTATRLHARLRAIEW
ncbi:MAG: hypothetical protein FJ290_07235 [Planctomycetes bacterium]|nr:hypothetical protein [Planctomycetota bacterium]